MRGSLGRVVLAGLLVSALAACAGRTPEPKIEYRTVSVPVPAPCAIDIPGIVKGLKVLIPLEQWQALAPGAKASAVEAQAGERLNYEERLSASYSGCPIKDSPAPPATSGDGDPVNLLPG